jgi:type II secretory pathway pseudopilin PulG
MINVSADGGWACGPQPYRAGGFTYLGVLFAVAAMGAILVGLSQVWHTTRQREKEEELIAAGDEIRRAIGHYYQSTQGKSERYPRSLEDLLKDPRYPGTRRYLRKIYRDPMTGGIEWGLLRTADGMILGIYSLSQAEPIKKAGFNLDDREFEGKTKYAEWVFVHKPRKGVQLVPPKGR